MIVRYFLCVFMTIFLRDQLQNPVELLKNYPSVNLFLGA